MYSRDQLARMLRIFVLESDNADLVSYWGQSDVPVDALIRKTEHRIRMGRMRGGRVLDIGCGFGWDSVLIAALGDATVVANDIRPSMTEVLDERLRAIREAGFDLPVSTLLGDICEADLPPDSYDSVFCAQAIEHIHDLTGMFRVVKTILRPGGRGVFLNDNNALHTPCRESSLAMWPRRDADQEFIDGIKRDRPIENADIEPYAVTRRRIVSEARPDLDAGAVATLVNATAGLTQPDIRRVATEYAPGRPLPQPPRWSWCRDPISGEYCERLLDPFEVADLARSVGLEARVWHRHFNRFPMTALNLVNGGPWPWINRLVFKVHADFGVVVRKPA